MYFKKNLMKRGKEIDNILSINFNLYKIRDREAELMKRLEQG